MAGSTTGNRFQVTTWGETHGKAVGAVVDGCPAGLELCEEQVQAFLDRRKPGQSRYTTKRKEDDRVEILSGVFEGRTTGTPISLIVYNTDQRSADYSGVKDIFRPGHADYTFEAKYGIRDYRGGGRSSGRETVGRVAAGAVASRLLQECGIRIVTYTKAIGPVQADESRMDYDEISRNPFFMPDAGAAEHAASYMEELMRKQDSAGGVIECRIQGFPAGYGEPVFHKLDAKLAQAVMSIGAVKGVEIGDGFLAASRTGSENNDSFSAQDGRICKRTNHAGGILGGISDGSEILLRAAVKPTPSIGREQQTVNRDGEETLLRMTGRHDPVIVPRAVVVVEAMAAITLADALLEGAVPTMDKLKRIL